MDSNPISDLLAEENQIRPLIYLLQPRLFPVQQDILKTYFHHYLKNYVQVLLDSAPVDLKSLRIHLALSSTTLKPEYFKLLIEQSYPAPSDNASKALKKQNLKIRNFFIAFNELCQDADSIHHALYQQVFDPRFLQKEVDSPIKQVLFSQYFTQKIKNHFKKFINPKDPWVSVAQDYINTLSSREPPSIARKLF